MTESRSTPLLHCVECTRPPFLTVGSLSKAGAIVSDNLNGAHCIG